MDWISAEKIFDLSTNVGAIALALLVIVLACIALRVDYAGSWQRRESWLN
jgi:hypothetical protein